MDPAGKETPPSSSAPGSQTPLPAREGKSLPPERAFLLPRVAEHASVRPGGVSRRPRRSRYPRHECLFRLRRCSGDSLLSQLWKARGPRFRPPSPEHWKSTEIRGGTYVTPKRKPVEPPVATRAGGGRITPTSPRSRLHDDPVRSIPRGRACRGTEGGSSHPCTLPA